MSYPYIMKDSFIAITIESKAYTIDNTHRNFKEIRDAIRDERWDEIQPLIDFKQAFEKRIIEEVPEASEAFAIDYDQELVTYYGIPIHSTLTNRIFNMWKEGFNIKPMVAFLKNLLQNPSSTAVNELYDFMETGEMPITEDGCFLAYKKVRMNYKDCHTGTVDNSIGQKPKMPRNMVDDNRKNTCSMGLHFCSRSYLSQYGSIIESRVMIVKINPADVVSIPADYQNTKGRCWTYEVYGEVSAPTAHEEEVFTQSVYPAEHCQAETDWRGEPTIDELMNMMKQELQPFSNIFLVRMFNELTGSHLVKFRNKESGIARIVGWMTFDGDDTTTSSVKTRFDQIMTYIDRDDMDSVEHATKIVRVVSPQQNQNELIYALNALADLRNTLSEISNSNLVEIYNTLTGNQLIKFRDKETGIDRLISWAKFGLVIWAANGAVYLDDLDILDRCEQILIMIDNIPFR